MTRYFKTSLVVAALLLLPVVQAATMSKADYKADKARIGAEHKANKAACASLSGNAKDICVEEAKAKEKVARAELEYSFSGKSSDQNKVLVAKSKAAYAVAKERCGAMAGDAKTSCVATATANFGKN